MPGQSEYPIIDPSTITTADLAALLALAVSYAKDYSCLAHHIGLLLHAFPDVTLPYDLDRLPRRLTREEREHARAMSDYRADQPFTDVRDYILSQAWEIVDAAYQPHQDIKRLSEPHQTVLLIYSAQGIIDNGGFHYFFESDFPNNPPYTVFIDAYRRIGAQDAADALAAAVARFPFPQPHLDCEARNQFMIDNSTEEEDVIEDLDCVCGDDEIFTLLLDYILLHLTAFPGIK